MMGYENKSNTIPNTYNPKDLEQAKDDSGKLHLSWCPPAIIKAVTIVREYGNKKYHDPNNWRLVGADRYHEAMLRHVLASWDDPWAIDPESGLPHIYHIACNVAFQIQLHDENTIE